MPPYDQVSRCASAMGMGRCVLLAVLFLASASAEVTEREHTLLENAANPMENVPVVGPQFKVHPVNTTMSCVINLTVQYLAIYTAIALCRTFCDLWGLAYEKTAIEAILQSAALTVNFAPMLAVLFLACRMRVTFLTQGQGNPQEYVQVWMYCCTYAILAMTVIVVVIPVFTGEVIDVDLKTGDIPASATPFTNWIAAGIFTAIKYLIMIGLYIGVLVIIYGTLTYEPRPGIWPAGQVPPVSPAVGSCVILSVMYFIIYALVQAVRTYSQFTNPGHKTRLEDALLTSTNAMNFAPMLSVLFIGARMRALQMDPVNGAPQKWAQNCFYMCAYATLAQVLVAIAVPLVMGGKAQVAKVEGDMDYKVDNPTLGTALIVARYAIMACIYIGFSCVIWSILTIQHPKGKQFTPPISVTMQCVINLTIQFFCIYLVIWVGVTVKELTKWNSPLLMQTMENAKATVQFCPMLAILFVATRMRALQLTNNQGAPQGWCQDGMYMATWAVLLQFTMVLVAAACTRAPAETDEDGNSRWEPKNKIALIVVQCIRWLGFILLYGGVITVIYGAMTLTRETANGQGAVPLVGDGVIPGVGVGVPGYGGIGEPVGVNDVPGVSP